MKQLYPHQVDAVAKVRAQFAKKVKRVCLQAPTGCGKTVIALHIIAAALARGNKVLFLVHVKELIEQTAAAATEEGLQYSYLAAGYPHDASKNFQIASTQTVSRRLKNVKFKPDFIVYDEAHHSVAETSLKVLERFKDIPLLGLTATPCRLDGKGLNQAFDNLVVTVSTRELIDKGFLSEFEYFAPESGINFNEVHTLAGDYNQHELEEQMDTKQIFGKVIENYKRYVDGEPAIVFALNVKHSVQVVAEFNAAGVAAAHIDAKTPRQERKQIVSDFKRGKVKVLSNVNIATEGFDMPACSAVFIARPTKSETLCLQMWGRGLRKSGAKVCKIFDHVENYIHHGLPDEERKWTLDGVEVNEEEKKKRKSYITCPHCDFTYKPVKPRICPKCGHYQEVIEQEIVHTSGVLQQVTNYSRKHTFSKEDVKLKKRQCKTLEEFRALAKELNYKPYWADMQMEFRRKWLTRFAN